jgi:polyhydroxybutyrate depolymerase
MERSAAIIAFAACLAATAAAASPGCGRPGPEGALELDVGGARRMAEVALPAGYDPARPHALIFAFHGRTNDHARVRRYLGLEAAARFPAIFVYPAGRAEPDGTFSWWDPGDPPDGLRDLSFFDALLELLPERYCIDRDAVFAVGHSLGATFANSLACARGKEIAAVATVAGGIATTECTGDAAALLLHHPLDRLVPIEEGERARDALLAAQTDRVEPTVEALGRFACERHAAVEVVVLWCEHDQAETPSGRHYPHLWPDAAAAAIMAFFTEILDPDERPRLAPLSAE